MDLFQFIKEIAEMLGISSPIILLGARFLFDLWLIYRDKRDKRKLRNELDNRMVDLGLETKESIKEKKKHERKKR